MAGAGSRFVEKGYKMHKPVIQLNSRHNNQTVPMVVEAVRDLPVDLERDDVNLCFIVRDFHIHEGIDELLLGHFPRAQFIEIDALTDGQAITCLHARNYFDVDLPLMISACDNGIDISQQLFEIR